MALNDPTAPVSGVRGPRWRALLNGTPLGGLKEAEVRQTAYYQPDTFHAVFAIDADPAFPLSWWSNQDTIQVEIQAALPSSPTDTPAWQSLIIGNSDRIHLDPVSRLVDVDGRDLGGQLQDARTTETFANQSAAEISATLAARHGMTANAQAPALVGQYYELEHSRQGLGVGHNGTTEWDLLAHLAKDQGLAL